MVFDVKFSVLMNLIGVSFYRSKQALSGIEEVLLWQSTKTYSVFTDSNIDGVIIGTPTDTHEALCIRALEANKHVLCEALGN